MSAGRRQGTGARGRRLALAVLLAASAAPGVAAAQGAADADTHFRHGVDLYKDADYTTALIEFQRAYEIQPSYQVLYNIGESQFQLQDYAGALRTLQRYLDEGGKKIPAKRRKDVERDLDKLKQRVAMLSVTTSEPGAAIRVDDVPAGTTPLSAPILVSAGRRKVTATLGARPPVSEVVQLAGGDTQAIMLRIPALAPSGQGATLLTPPRLAFAGTGLAAVGAVVTGILALGASGDLKDQLGMYPADAQAITRAHTKALALGVTTDVLGAAALSLCGISIYLTVKASRAPAEVKPSTAPAARIVVLPGGAALAGAF